MKKTASTRRRAGGRAGKVIVLMALLMPVLVGMVALSVDTAVIATARAQMQTATDSAALAAAKQLATDRRLQGVTDLSPEIKAAQTRAVAMFDKNPVLNDAPVLHYASGTAKGEDILVGYLSPSDTSSTGPDPAAATTSFNSVKIFGYRDTRHVGAVPSFFGAILGQSRRNLSVSSTATVQNYTIRGFKTVGNLNAHLLPIVMSVDNYDAMMAGTPDDDYAYDTETEAVSRGSDGVPESLLYPIRTGSGNWGTVKIGVSNNSTSTLGNQIRYGITPSQLATFPNSTIALDSTLDPPSLTLGGNPGISSGIKDDLTSIIGKPVTIPIYDEEGGNGNNQWYRIVAFAGVRIVHVDFQGNPKYVVVQPALVDDSTAIAGEVQSSWTQGGVVRLFLSR